MPKEYKPFSNIRICTNTLQDVQYVIQHRASENEVIYPILIGAGSVVPRIWITNPNNEAIISDNNSKLWFIKIDIDEKNRSILIKIGTDIVFSAYIKKETCFVSHINLNPFGYNITGDENQGLKIGNANLRGNTFSSLQTMVAI